VVGVRQGPHLGGLGGQLGGAGDVGEGAFLAGGGGHGGGEQGAHAAGQEGEVVAQVLGGEACGFQGFDVPVVGVDVGFGVGDLGGFERLRLLVDVDGFAFGGGQALGLLGLVSLDVGEVPTDSGADSPLLLGGRRLADGVNEVLVGCGLFAHGPGHVRAGGRRRQLVELGGARPILVPSNGGFAFEVGLGVAGVGGLGGGFGP